MKVRFANGYDYNQNKLYTIGGKAMLGFVITVFIVIIALGAISGGLFGYTEEIK
jgi:hypothetical protein